MASIKTLQNDPDVLWIRMRTAIREGNLTAAVDAVKRLEQAGIIVRIIGLDVAARNSGVTR